MLQRELTDQTRMADGLVNDLAAAYSEGQGERGTLDYLRIVSDPEQTAVQYRAMLSDVRTEYLEFSRPPYAVDPLDEQLVKQARQRGVTCRLLIESGTLDDAHRQRLERVRRGGRRDWTDRIAAHEAGGVRWRSAAWWRCSIR